MKLKLLLLVLTLQTAWILGTTFVQERALARCPVVLLEIQPLDQHERLRGNQVVLNYKISNVPLALFSPPLTNAPPPGRTLYVALEPRGAFHELTRASTAPLAATGDEVVLKGQSRYGRATNSVHVKYGLERYYVREGTGNPSGKLTVQVAVPASGHGVIRQVFVDGKPYAEAMRKERR